MTIGRTSSGAIKIKTDTAGVGLRAVDCACCCSLTCSGTFAQFCGATQIQVVNGEILSGCNDGGSFCSMGACLFTWGKPGYGSASLDTDIMVATININGSNGIKFNTSTIFGTYSNGYTLQPV
jgi:hypothetical protein